MSTQALYVILFLFSLGFAAFFCSAETAFISIQKLRLEHLVQRGHPSARKLARTMEHPEKFLATVLLGINFFETAVATLGTILAVSLWGKNVGLAVATVVVAALTLVFAEFVPKTVGARFGERLALRYVGVIAVISAVLYPLVWALNRIGLSFSKVAGDEYRPTITEEEFRAAISVGEKEGVVEKSEADMLHKVFEFGDRLVREVMIPRTDVVWLEKGATLADFLSVYTQHPHTRYPVYEGSSDNVVGIVTIKDVLLTRPDCSKDIESAISSLIRPAYFVPETKRIGELMSEMRAVNHQMVVVVDEYGGTAGIVTMQQLIAEIVGEVGDELARQTRKFETLGEHTYEIDGGMRVEEANEHLGLELPAGDYETVAGLILTLLGRVPKEGDQAKYDRLRLTVTEMKAHKIEKVHITREQPAA